VIVIKDGMMDEFSEFFRFRAHPLTATFTG